MSSYSIPDDIFDFSPLKMRVVYTVESPDEKYNINRLSDGSVYNGNPFQLNRSFHHSKQDDEEDSFEGIFDLEM